MVFVVMFMITGCVDSGEEKIMQQVSSGEIFDGSYALEYTVKNITEKDIIFKQGNEYQLKLIRENGEVILEKEYHFKNEERTLKLIPQQSRTFTETIHDLEVGKYIATYSSKPEEMKKHKIDYEFIVEKK